MNEAKVLIIDDEAPTAELIAEFLHQNGVHQTTIETSPQEVLDKYTFDESSLSLKFNCIICDYNMPQLNGLEVLEHVRNENPDIPFILYTGKGSEEIASKAISAGVSDYMQKSSGSDHYLLLANRVKNQVSSYTSLQQSRNTINTTLLKSISNIFKKHPGNISEKINNLLMFGTNYLNLQTGFLAKTSPSTLSIQNIFDQDTVRFPKETPITESYCQYTIEQDPALIIEDASEHDRFNSVAAFQEGQIHSYIGQSVYVNGELYGTLCFMDTDTHEFTDNDELFVDLLAQWVGYELTQHYIQKYVQNQLEETEEYTKNVQHDITNVLSVAQGNIELLEPQISKMDGDIQDRFNTIRQSLTRIEDLFDSMKLLHTTDSILPEHKTEEVMFEEVCADSWKEFCTENISSLHLKNESDTKAKIIANKNLLKHVFGNLFVNSLDHNGPETEVFVTYKTTENGDITEIQITDTGSGINSKLEEDIFISNITTEDSHTGCGLSIVKRIIDLHGWGISVQNSEEEPYGATFTITTTQK